MAVDSETGLAEEQLQDGKRFLVTERAQAQAACLAWAEQKSRETGKTWHGIVRVYHPANPEQA